MWQMMRLETADVDTAESQSFHIIAQRDDVPSIHDDAQNQCDRTLEEYIPVWTTIKPYVYIFNTEIKVAIMNPLSTVVSTVICVTVDSQ